MIIDPRFTKLAEGLTGFSTSLKPGERVLIDAYDVPDAMVIALVRAARARGALPYVQLHRARITRELALGAEESQYGPASKIELERMRQMNAYIALRGSDNIFEGSDIPSARVQLISRLMKPVLDHRVGKTKWVVLRWPTSAMAQQAGLSTEAFEDFYFEVCTLDYARFKPGMKALATLMDGADQVRIKGPGTDLKFSIKGIGAKECGGQYNIPDGEVFSCPVRDSVEGFVQYNAPTVYLGSSFDQIRLAFRKGKIVEATSTNTARLNEILDSDEGARFIGEFAIGFNPRITEPMRDILFDEKIAGSFHFTPGQAYAECGNGNVSQVHWDMVSIQRPEYGGGEIWFDGKLIRKDGLFVPKALHKLNPEHPGRPILNGRLEQRISMEPAEVARYWEANADAWTRLTRAGHDVYRDALNTPAFLATLPPIKSLSGLDVGCGEGSNTRKLAQLGAKMQAIDIAPTFIRHARAAEQSDPLGISYQVGNAMDLPFADGSFDFVTAFMLLMDLQDQGRALREARRVLKPGGFVQFSILHPCFVPPHRKVLRENDGKVRAIEIGRYYDCIDGKVESWCFSNLPDEERERVAPFRIPRFHRTLSAWVEIVRGAGLVIERFGEPCAGEELALREPIVADSRVAPLFLHILASKPGAPAPAEPSGTRP